MEQSSFLCIKKQCLSLLDWKYIIKKVCVWGGGLMDGRIVKDDFLMEVCWG